MIDFVKEHIIYRFGIPQTITTDQGTMFTSGEFDEFAIGMGVKVLNSSPYFAQANGQAEACNKGIIKLIKRKIEENPRRWHTLLNEVLCHTQWLVMGRPKFHLISWCKHMMQCYLGKLRLGLGDYLFKIN